MRKNCAALVLSLLLILISTSTSFAQDIPASSENETTPLSIQGIWMISFGDSEITMAVNQSGDSLFGQAKFEGEEPWNGVISGSISGRAVHIAMAALQGKVLVSTMMSGTAQDESIAGNYVSSDGSSLVAEGEFTAARINPDTADYTPAEIAEPPQIAPTSTTPAQVAPTPVAPTQIAPSEQEALPEIEPEPAVQTKSRRFNDVRDLAKGIDPNIMPWTAPL